jgi:hypothetical protein
MCAELANPRCLRSAEFRYADDLRALLVFLDGLVSHAGLSRTRSASCGTVEFGIDMRAKLVELVGRYDTMEERDR